MFDEMKRGTRNENNRRRAQKWKKSKNIKINNIENKEEHIKKKVSLKKKENAKLQGLNKRNRRMSTTKEKESNQRITGGGNGL